MPWMPKGIVAAAFGNDGPLTDERVKREVTFLRQRLPELGIRELGFGISPDGKGWALLVEAETFSATEIGRALRAELMVPLLENAVRQAWAGSLRVESAVIPNG
jgi:hypothetical protein